jgi:hypothetical protein
MTTLMVGTCIRQSNSDWVLRKFERTSLIMSSDMEYELMEKRMIEQAEDLAQALTSLY